MQARKNPCVPLVRIARTLALAIATACSSEPAPTGPDSPALPEDLAQHAFQLTIDGPTGRVTIREPGASAQPAGSRAGGPSLSLLGREAVRLHAGDCAFSSIPNNAKQRRCTMTLAVQNLLSSADLVTPTTLPRPPQGASGILVFPYTAAALGVPGGSAVPNTLWDGAPANFFNDFSGCTTGKTSDCYRWESYPSPLYGGATSEVRTVGFDIDKNAGSVAVYVVVAADLRDNPTRMLTVRTQPGDCGEIRDAGGDRLVFVTDENMQVNSAVDADRRGFCSFDLSALPSDGAILSAVMRILQVGTVGQAVDFGPVLVDHLDYGTLQSDDYDRAALSSAIGSLPVGTGPLLQTLEVKAAVTADLAASRTQSQFRFRLADETSFFSAAVNFAGPAGMLPPELVISYRNR